MKLTIKYIHDGLAGEVTTIPADIIKWEAKTKQKVSDLFDKEELRIGLGDLSIFIWAALTRQVVTNEAYETWILRLDEITDFGEYEAPKATKPEASTDSA